MNPFQPFLDAYGPGYDCRLAPAERITSYKSRLPELLLEFWRLDGFCGYRDGLFWFVDPEEFVDILEEWKVDSYTVFARSGFADLFLWSTDGWSILNVHLGNVYPMGSSNVDTVINKSLTIKSIMDGILQQKIHRKVVKRLGKLSADECYAFVPALALGGPATPESVQRVKLKEQLSILAQIHGR